MGIPFSAPEGRSTPAWWTPLDTRSLDLITRARFRGLDETFIYLCRERATEDLGKLLFKEKIPHMFTVGSFLNRYALGPPNSKFSCVARARGISIEPEFRTSVMKVPSRRTHDHSLAAPETPRNDAACKIVG